MIETNDRYWPKADIPGPSRNPTEMVAGWTSKTGTDAGPGGVRLAAAILAFCALAGAARAQDCRLHQYGSVPLHVADMRVSLPVTIGGVPRDFGFSLQGTFNIMSLDLVEELKIPIRRLPRDVEMRSFRESVTVPELIIGNIRMTDVQFLVGPRELGNPGVRGMIAIGMFGRTDIELDMAGRKLNLFSQDHCPGKVVYWTQAFSQVPFEQQGFGFVRPKMELDGKPVTVALNLNARSAMDMGAAKKLFGLDENSPGMTVAQTAPDGVKVYHYPFKTLSAGDFKVANPAIAIVGVPSRPGACPQGRIFDQPDSRERYTLGGSACYGDLTLFLGYSVLSKLRLYFSMKEKLLYITDADAH